METMGPTAGKGHAHHDGQLDTKILRKAHRLDDGHDAADKQVSSNQDRYFFRRQV